MIASTTTIMLRSGFFTSLWRRRRRPAACLALSGSSSLTGTIAWSQPSSTNFLSISRVVKLSTRASRMTSPS